MTPPSYFLYARKSSRQRERQALSIPGQLRALRQHAKERKLSVAAEIIERRSAHTPGRPLFNDMMRRIEAGEANGILAWHPNRLARNGLDGGTIVTFLDSGKLVDLKFATFWFENTPQGKANLGHEFVQTKQSSDTLSVDTQRGLHEKAAKGHFPGSARRGYLNDKATKTIALDPHLAPLIKNAFEIYSRGDKALEDMQEFFAGHGVLTKKHSNRRPGRGGNRLHVDLIRRMLSDPFYYGDFDYAGERYEGKHKPIVTKRLWDKVQAVLQKRSSPKKDERQPKAFTRLLHCGECRMAVTAEVQKGHTYYRCTRKSRAVKCTQKFLREEQLDEQLSRLLRTYVIEKKMAAEILTMAQREYEELARNADAVVETKEQELSKLSAKLEKLTTFYIEGDIDRDSFLRKKEDLLSQKRGLREAILTLEHDASKAWLEPLAEWLKTAQLLAKIATTGSPMEKRRAVAEIFGSNLFLESQKARGYAVKPWSLLAPSNGFLPKVRLYREARTHFEQKQCP